MSVPSKLLMMARFSDRLWRSDTLELLLDLKLSGQPIEVCPRDLLEGLGTAEGQIRLHGVLVSVIAVLLGRRG